MFRPNRIIGAIIVGILYLFICPWGKAGEQQERIEEKTRAEVDQAPSRALTDARSRLGVEYGGWLNYRYNRYTNTDNDPSLKDALRNTHYVDLRYWLKFTLRPGEDAVARNEHHLYLRLRDQYIQRTGAAPGARYDLDGPHVEYAYAVLDYQPVWVEAGRRYFNVGRGIVYSNIHDGLQVNYRVPGFNAGVFAAKSLPHEQNIDLSVPGYDKDSERYFYGLGIGYTGIKDQSLYGFFMAQNDFSDTHSDNLNQDFTYNSQYIGMGSKGKVLSWWEYWLELVRETGASHTYGTNERKDVDAWAGDVEIACLPAVVTHPRLSFEYALGSGDADRQNVTDTEFGNTSGRDKNFLYFGYAPTGFALAPRLSNLQFFRTGLELAPFERNEALNKLTVGVNFYRFLKQRSAGAISDAQASQDSNDVGREVDVYLDWAILSDLSVGVEYGHFMPGGAYADPVDAAEDFFSVSITHTF